MIHLPDDFFGKATYGPIYMCVGISLQMTENLQKQESVQNCHEARYKAFSLAEYEKLSIPEVFLLARRVDMA